MRRILFIPVVVVIVFVLSFSAQEIHAYAASNTVDSSWCSGNGFSWDLTTSTCTLTGDANIAYGNSLVNPAGTTLVISSGVLDLEGGLTNDGTLDITASGLADHVAIIMDATCDPLSPVCSPANSLLTNHGTINIQNIGGTSVNAVSTGIEVASGTLNNTGTINIKSNGGEFNFGIFSPTEGNAVLFASNFLNYGTVNVANSGNGYGIEEDQSSGDNTITFSNVGTINIENSGGYGFLNAAVFSNSGTFNLDNSGGYGLFSDSTLTNTASGTITIENTTTGLTAPIVQNPGSIIDEACGTYSTSGFISYSGNAIQHSNTCIMSFSERGFSGETWGVAVNGTNYTTSNSSLIITGLSQTSDYQYDSSVAAGTGVQYTCSTGCSGSVSNTPGYNDANYLTQYYLTVASPYGTTIGQGWYNADSSATFGLDQNLAGGGLVEYRLAGWNSTDPGGYSGTYPSPAGLTETITINNPVTETASWGPYYLVTYKNTGCGSSSARYLAAGSLATPPSQLPDSVFPLTEARCSLVSDNSTTTPLTGATTIAATYLAQFLLTIDDSTGPNSSPISEWVDAGTTVTPDVNSPLQGGPGLQYLASGWTINPSPLSGALTSRGDATSGTGNTASFPMFFFGSITWNWNKQLTATQNGNWNDSATWGGASFPATIASGDIVIIPAGIIVTIPSGITITDSGNITVASGGTINDNSVLVISGQLTNGGTINISGNELEVYGTLDNKGTISFTSDNDLFNQGTVTNECGSKISGTYNLLSGSNQPVNKICDTSPPTLSITQPSNLTSLDHISSVNGTASDDTFVSSVTGKIDGGQVLVATTSDIFAHWSFVTPGLSNGPHVIQINTTDSVGLVTSQILSITVDNVPPTTTTTLSGTQGANKWYASPVSVTLNAVDNSDGSGVKSTTYSLDGGPHTTYSIPFTISGDSNHTLTFNSTDNAGNAELPNTLHIAIDTIPPVITVPSDVTQEATGPQTIVTLGTAVANDAVDGAVTVTNNATTTYPVGITKIQYSATDLAGNTAIAYQTVTVHDTTPPVLTVPTQVTAQATGPSGAQVTYTTSAIDLVDGPVTPVCNLPSGNTFAFGTTLVTCTATDIHNNTSTGTFNVLVQNKMPPTLSISSPVNNALVNTATVSISGTASDIVSVSKISWKVDTGAISTVSGITPGPNVSWSIATNNLLIGSHVIQVNATDSAGLVTISNLAITYVSPTGSITSTSGTGQVTFAVNNGGFTSLGSIPISGLPTPPPPGLYPLGFFTWSITGFAPATSIPVTVTSTTTLPPQSHYFKLIGGTWVSIPVTVSGNKMTFVITDNGPFDGNPAVGVISDPGTIVDPTNGRITGGGNIGKGTNFGFEVTSDVSKTDQIKGNFEYSDKYVKLNLNSNNISLLSVGTTTSQATFVGTGSYDRHDKHDRNDAADTFLVSISDPDKTGQHDTLSITVTNSTGNVIYQNSGTVKGHVEIHKFADKDDKSDSGLIPQNNGNNGNDGKHENDHEKNH